MSNNPKLKRLTTYGNPKLGSLDLSRNPELKTLNCCHNSLSALDVTKCPKIDTLYCAYNEIGTLDLTQSAELVWINCQNNRIDKLDVSNTKIGYLMAPDNRIASVNMGDKTFDTPSPSGSGYEDAGLPYLYINLNNNQLTDIDLSKQKYLYWLEISGQPTDVARPDRLLESGRRAVRRQQLDKPRARRMHAAVGTALRQ